MRLTEIDIDRFRIWRDLLLKLNPQGLNVIYGPNEAGKTTLMRFIRATLYGYQPLSEEPGWGDEETRSPWRGALRCEHAGRTWRVHRRAEMDGRGQIRISGQPDGLDPDAALQTLLAETSEEIFRDVFALGVRELNQLATLGTGQVAQYIYGLSLGPQGRQILSALDDLGRKRHLIINEQGDAGTLPALYEQYAALSGSSSARNNDRETHAALTRERCSLQSEIDQLQQREQKLDGDLHATQHILACHKPWKKSGELRKEISGLPLVTTDPAEAIAQLTSAEQDLQKAGSSRDRHQEQSEEFRQQAQRLQIDAKFQKERYAVQGLVDQSEWLRQLEQQIHDAESRAGEMRRELNHQLRALGDGWTLERLAAVDVSPEAHSRLLDMARRYQDALQVRSRLRRRVRSLTRRSTESLMQLNELLDALEIPIEEAIEREQSRLRELENLGRLRLQEEQLALKIQTVRRILERVDVHDSVPPWVDRLMTATGWIGAALSLFGIAVFSLGGDARRSLGGALSAASFAAAGILWWCLRNGLRNHFDATTGIRLEDIAAEARQADRQLRTIQERIERMSVAEQRAHASGTGSREWKSSTAEMVDRIGDCSQRIAELEVLQRRQLRVASERMRLKLLRNRFRTAQQTLTAVRREWCQLLQKIGIQETLRIEQAFQWWRQIQDVRELATQCRNLAPEAEGLQRISDAMRQRIEQVGRRLNNADQLDFSRPLEVLSKWQNQLQTHDRDHAERERLQAEAEKRSRESLHQQHLVEAAELRREAILTRAGASDREGLVRLQQALVRRKQLEEQLQAVNEELLELSLSEPSLAITEEDLNRFDPQQGRQTVQLHTSELTDVRRRLQTCHQQLGRVRQELELLESSRESQDVFFRRSHIAGQIHQQTEEWLALQLELEAVHEIRRQFEQDNISGTLVTASSCLHRMTAGRYHRIWAPLGKDFLCVDDEFGQTSRVEQLSGGTREQLFLAIRFALAQEFHRRGVELPLVMDDLFVNFDLERTEAAVDCLLEVASGGQQILFFTCHEHVAAMFRKRGTEPLWLPGHRAAYDALKPEGENPAAQQQAFIANSDDLLDDSAS